MTPVGAAGRPQGGVRGALSHAAEVDVAVGHLHIVICIDYVMIYYRIL